MMGVTLNPLEGIIVAALVGSGMIGKECSFIKSNCCLVDACCAFKWCVGNESIVMGLAVLTAVAYVAPLFGPGGLAVQSASFAIVGSWLWSCIANYELDRLACHFEEDPPSEIEYIYSVP